eukprot:6173144-Pleurochrysis_carterae.AAC.3
MCVSDLRDCLRAEKLLLRPRDARREAGFEPDAAVANAKAAAAPTETAASAARKKRVAAARTALHTCHAREE